MSSKITAMSLKNLRLALLPFNNLPAVRQFGVLSLRQCSSYASVRVQRLLHLLQLYKLLYNERTVSGLLRNWYGHWYRSLLRPKLQTAFGGGFLLSLTAFSFSDHGINEDELNKASDLINLDDSDEENETESDQQTVGPYRKCPPSQYSSSSTNERNWEPLIQKDNFNLSRRPMGEDTYLYEYRCTGTYTDIPPIAFFLAQMDLDYRKEWDQLVISLDVVDRETETGSEVVRWVTHFPYPMYPREYVYVRKTCVDQQRKTLILTSKSVNHPACPRDDKKCVRVDTYYSNMIIKSHGAFHENGLDYELTYCDDPKASFPRMAYDWMVNTGVVGFLDRVHAAAKVLTERHVMSPESQHSKSSATAGNPQSNIWQRLLPERHNYAF